MRLDRRMDKESQRSTAALWSLGFLVVVGTLSPGILIADDLVSDSDLDTEELEDDLLPELESSDLVQDPGPYSSTITASYEADSGNSNTETSTADVTFSKLWENNWGLNLSASAKSVTTETSGSSTTHTDQYDFDLYVTRKLSDNLSLIVLEEWAKDVNKGYEHQNVVGLGLLWSAINKDKWAMTLHGAPAWADEKYATGESDEYPVGILEIYNKLAVSSNTSLKLTATYYRSLDDSSDPHSDERFDGKLEIDTSINSIFSLTFTYDLEYDFQPVGGAAHTTDRTFTAGLTVTLKGKSESSSSSSSSSNGSSSTEESSSSSSSGF